MSKRATFLIDLGDDERAFELMELLDQYIKLTGWSRKRFYLVGAAEIVGKENPVLAEKIAEYVTR